MPLPNRTARIAMAVLLCATVSTLPTAASSKSSSATLRDGASATLRVNITKGCSAKVVGPKIKRKLSSTATLRGLRPGLYTITSRCAPVRKVRLQAGQRKKVRVAGTPSTEQSNPRQVPTTLSGSFLGSSVSDEPSTQNTTWEGTVTLTLTGPQTSIGSLNFPYAAHYRVTAIAGTVRPLPVEPNPTLCYGQNGSRTFGLADVDSLNDGGDAYAGGAYDPWAWAGHGFIYNIYVAGTTSGWQEVGTQSCPSDTGVEIQPYTLAIPSELLLTDGWTGLPSNSQPVKAGDNFTGEHKYANGNNTLTWKWDLRGSEYVSIDGPPSIPGADLTPLVP
jgi:hypothetical protein